MEISYQGLKVIKSDEFYKVIDHDHVWQMDKRIRPCIKVAGRCLYFEDALVKEEYYQAKITPCILSQYVFSDDLIIETMVFFDVDGDVRFELIPVNDTQIDEIIWPGYFRSDDEDGYSVLPIMQGVLLPNRYDYDYDRLDFDGFFYSHDAYVSFFMQREKDHGYMTIVDDPDTKYDVIHQSEITGTSIGIRHVPSFGKLSHKRMIRYHFAKDLDYVKASKYYRGLMIEKGHFRTLKEKAMTLNQIDDLVGASYIHFGIKSHTDEESSFYDPLKAKDVVIPFKKRLAELKMIKERYPQRLYVHIDGWAEPGYDNMHPDYFPVCIEAGGAKDLKELVDYLKEQGDLIALHDQYRDYYHKARSYDIDNSVKDDKQMAYSHARWAGGRQDYLCASLALDYIKRNFTYLFKDGICPNASYLDVFTCNEMDECNDPRHVMSRADCAYYRKAAFNYLISKHIIPTSEECTDWSLDVLVSCHYGPYEFMLKRPGSKKMGIPIPLFNLVYHECIIIPWMMDVVDGEDYMLYALINGGLPYLIREGAYPNVDGAFGHDSAFEDDARRCLVVSTLHQKVAYCELVEHHILDKEGKIQKSVFADGTSVRIDLRDNTYVIS